MMDLKKVCYGTLIIILCIMGFKLFCHFMTKEQRNKKKKVILFLHFLIHGCIFIYMQEMRQFLSLFFFLFP